MAAALFEDVFCVTEVDKEGKRFDRVSRIECRGEDHDDVSLSLDYNSEIYKLPVSQKFEFLIRKTLTEESTLATRHNKNTAQRQEFDQSGDPSIVDKYEYVMYGKIFKILNSSKKKNLQTLYASFGGLLMALRGEPVNFKRLALDDRVYILLRKI